MFRILSTTVLACGLGLGAMGGVTGCQSDANNSPPESPAPPTGSPGQTPQGNMQGPAHSNGTEGADAIQTEPPVQQAPGATGSTNQQMGNQGQLPTTQPQP